MSDEKNDVPLEAQHVPKSGVDQERAELLASLPDPDANLSDEERRAVVGPSRPSNTMISASVRVSTVRACC
jgi:hypothetical protein